jgi:hypothetical protein
MFTATYIKANACYSVVICCYIQFVTELLVATSWNRRWQQPKACPNQHYSVNFVEESASR